MASSSLAGQTRSRLEKLWVILPQWVLCFIGGLLVSQLSSLNASLHKQNQLLANQNELQVALVNNTSAISNHIANAQSSKQQENMLAALTMEVRKLRETIEKQKGKQE